MNKIKRESRLAHATCRSCMQKEAHLQPCWRQPCSSAALSCLVPLRDPSAVNVNMRWRVKTYAAGKRARAAQGSLARCQRTLVRGPAHLKNMPVVALGYPTLSRFARWKRAPQKGTSTNIPPPRECLRVSKPGHENRPRRFCSVRRKLAKDALLFAARAPYYPATSCDHKSPTCNLLKRSTFCLKFQTLCLVLRAVQYLLNLLRCLLRHCFHLPHWKGKKRTAFVKLR